MNASRLKAKVAKLKAKKAPLRPLDQAVANDRELSAQVAENADRVKAKLGALRAENAYADPRRDPLVDRDVFEEIQSSLRHGHHVRLTSRTPGAVIVGGDAFKTTKTSHWIEKAERARIKAGKPIEVIRRAVPVHLETWKAIERVDRSRRRRGNLEKVLWVPHWDRTGYMLKSLGWSMAIWERGGVVMSVNMADAVIQAAQRDQRGFAAHMRERLKRELRAASIKFGFEVPEFFCVVEASDLGVPHLHGGILAPTGEHHRKAVRDALYVASHGKTNKAERTGREVDLKSEYLTPAIWADYAGKWWRGSADRLEGRVFAATTPVRAWGKAWYERMRRTEAKIGGHETEDDVFARLA